MKFEEFMSMPKGMDIQVYEKKIKQKNRLVKKLKEQIEVLEDCDDALSVLEDERGSYRHSTWLTKKYKASKTIIDIKAKLDALEKELKGE